MSSAYFRGESGDHWCDIRHRGHYDPCGCRCDSCTAARTPRPVVDDEPDDPRIAQVEDQRDYGEPDDYDFEDSPDNPNIPRR